MSTSAHNKDGDCNVVVGDRRIPHHHQGGQIQEYALPKKCIDIENHESG